MEIYLSQLKNFLNEVYSNNERQLHVVIGNESCDLDSAASALALAYFLHSKDAQDNQRQIYYVPVLNISRSDYRLRTEVRCILSDLFGNSVENWLVFVDEVKLDDLCGQGRLSLTLVDHHKLSHGLLDRYGAVVRRVIDHHVESQPKELSYQKQCSGDDNGFSRYVTDTVGSCSTLIAERIAKAPYLDQKVSTLLLGAILIDTNKLKDPVKTTPRDRAMVDQLEANFKDSNYNRIDFHKRLSAAKIDVRGMNVEEILAKDYKGVRRSSNDGRVGLSSIGMSTIPLSFEALEAKAAQSVEVQFENFRRHKGVDALVLLCVNKEPDVPHSYKKQVVIFGNDPEKDQIFGALNSIDGLGLVLTFGEGKVRVYRQSNPGFSRKQLLPELERLLDGRSGTENPSKSEYLVSSPPPKEEDRGKPQEDAFYGVPDLGAENFGLDRSSSGSRAKKFLESTDVARSFSVTYDDDEDDYLNVGPSHHKLDTDAFRWSGDAGAGHLGPIDESQRLSSTASADYESYHHDGPLDELSPQSHSSLTDDEARHYPTVNTPYATSSYDGGGPSAATGSGNTQNEESGATLSGVPDLLDSRENLADILAGIPTGTPDILADYYSPVSDAGLPFSMPRGQNYDHDTVDLLQGTTSNRSLDAELGSDVGLACGYSGAARALDYGPSVVVELTKRNENEWNPPIQRNAERWKRDMSEPNQFDFSSDPSPADGRSRAETPPSTPPRLDEARGRRNFMVGVQDSDDDHELGLKAPGAITPPNTFVDHYLEDHVDNIQAAAGRRASQQSELEPAILYSKLKGARARDNANASPSASSAQFIQASIPGTPPNSFIGTPMFDLVGGSPTWDSSKRLDGNVFLEPESLRKRVTELKKALPPEDVNPDGSNGVRNSVEERPTDFVVMDDRFGSDLESGGDRSGIDNLVIRESDYVESIKDRVGIDLVISDSKGDHVESDDRLDESFSIFGRFADELSRNILPQALAELCYPEVAGDYGFDNAAFSSDSTATVSPLSTAEFGDSVSLGLERTSPNVEPENLMNASKLETAPLPMKLPLDLLGAGIRCPFDLVSCSSAASFGRESTMAHADSTEFNFGRRTAGPDENARVQMDFGDESDNEQNLDAVEKKSENAGGAFEEDGGGLASGVVEWEEEGYPALLDIHQNDSGRIFSDQPGRFDELSKSPEPNEATVVPNLGHENLQEADSTSLATESRPDSPKMESGDEEPKGAPTPSGLAAAGEGLEWENDTPVLSPQKQTSEQWAASADIAEERRWRSVTINGVKHEVDMAIVEPYQRVISHGGYYGEGLNAIAVFAACYLPSRNEENYQVIMDNLFLYAVSVLDTLVAEDYVVVYFQGGSTSNQMPPFSWLRRCYHLIDRRHVSHTEVGLDRKLRKNLKSIFLVHPTLWLKTVVMMAKPFISSKFSQKVHFIQTLNDLGKLICMDQVEIPDEVLKHDHERIFARSQDVLVTFSRRGNPEDSQNSSAQARVQLPTAGNAMPIVGRQ